MSKKKLKFRIEAVAFLNEVKGNDVMAYLTVPFSIFQSKLGKIATRASELNDPILNEIMSEMALYEVTNPSSKEYDHSIVEEIERLADEQREKESIKNVRK